MEKRRITIAISASILLAALWISGCTTMDPETNRILSGAPYSSGWVGIKVAYRFKGLSKSPHAIVSVGEGTPASRAGVMVGDEIYFIGAVNTGYIDTAEVARLLRESGPQVVIKVKRKGQKGLLTFVLSKTESRPARRQGLMESSTARAMPVQRALSPPKSVAGASSAEAHEPSRAAETGLETQRILPYTTIWGFRLKRAPDNGVLVRQVTPGSPADRGGLKAGDVILALDGVAVKNFRDFSRPPYVPVKVLVRRQGAEIERTVLPHGIRRLKVIDLKEKFSIPGVPAPENPTSVSAIDALDCINVLDRVIVDPQSGKIAIIGHYDKSYDTGRIPYLDLLKTALADPSPVLNLEPTPDTKKEIMATEDHVRSNLEIMVDAVRGNPGFERERQLMIRELAKLYGITPEEYAEWFNYVDLTEKTEILPPPAVRDIQIKVFKHIGYTDVARALELLYRNTSEGAVKALQILGHGDEARSILDSGKSDDEIMHDLMAAAYLEIPVSAHVISAKKLQPLRDWYRAKKTTWKIVVRNIQNNLMPYTPKDRTDLGSNIMIKAFTAIDLSPKAVQFLEKLPTPYASIVAIDLDGHSQLARIMYEADYALKSLSVMPELFQKIPGSLSRNQYQHEHGLLKNRGKLDYRQWLEPEMVGMEVSPDHRVIRFTSSKMHYFFADNSVYWKRPPNKELERRFAPWCDHFMDHYDDYARIVPAFHEVREAAKVLALAKWALAENISLDLRGVTQARWNRPDKVPAFYVLSEGVYNNGMRGTTRAFEGGVSFKTRGNWTRITPSTTTTTEETSAQLALSAQIGQKAVQAADSGDLEKARYLSELSAEAMTGELSRDDLARQNIVLPAAKPVPVSPAAMQLQKEMIKATHRQIVEMGRNPGADREAAQTLNQIGHLYQQIQDHPVEASDYLKMLQTGRVGAPPPVPAPKTPPAASKPAVWAPCEDPVIRDQSLPLTPERREFLNDRLFEARERLKYINTALKNLIKINERQRAQIAAATRDISKAYDQSVDRAWSVVFDLLINLPPDKFLDNYEVAKDKLEDAMKYRTGLLTTSLSSAARKRILAEIRQIQIGREHLDEIYQGSERLLHVFKGANYGYDIDQWNSETRDDYKKAKDGALMIGKLVLDYPKLEEYLKTTDFFRGEKYFQVLAMGRMAYYGTGFFLDILAQKLAWEPLTGKLQNDLKNNIQAMENLRRKAAGSYREIGCIESALNR